MNAAKDPTGGGSEELDAAMATFFMRREIEAAVPPEQRVITKKLASTTAAAIAAIGMGEEPQQATGDFETFASSIIADDALFVGSADRAREVIGFSLIQARRFEAASTFITRLSTAEAVYRVWTSLSGVALRLSPTYGQDIVAGMYSALIVELNNTDPPKAIEFLHLMRRDALEAKPSADSILLFMRTTDWLQMLVGDQFDGIRDWVETESVRYPDVDWPSILSIVGESDLWPEDMSVFGRMALAQRVAHRLQTIATADPLDKRDLVELRSYISAETEELQNIPAVEYFLALTATRLFARSASLNKFARVAVADINYPQAVAYVAEALLSSDCVDEGRRIIMGISDPTVLVGMLLSEAWPDRNVPAKILNDLVELEEGRLSKPIFSQYTLGLRAACMHAVADMQEQAGRADEAARLRHNVEVLAESIKRGRVIVKRPKRS